jgi:hypothetical protein
LRSFSLPAAFVTVRQPRDPQGNNIGSIRRLMIKKISGRVAYVP